MDCFHCHQCSVQCFFVQADHFKLLVFCCYALKTCSIFCQSFIYKYMKNFGMFFISRDCNKKHEASSWDETQTECMHFNPNFSQVYSTVKEGSKCMYSVCISSQLLVSVLLLQSLLILKLQIFYTCLCTSLIYFLSFQLFFLAIFLNSPILLKIIPAIYCKHNYN